MIALANGTAPPPKSIAVFFGIVLLAGVTFLNAQQAPLVRAKQVDVRQLVRDMINNELNSNPRDHNLWMYRSQRIEGGKTTVKEVVETKSCDIRLVLSVNGQALAPDQRRKENERLRKLVNDPEGQRKIKHGQEEDDHKAVEMFKLLPEVFLYRFGSDRGSLVELTFWPNPDFRPASREEQVLHGMEGTMSVDSEKKRLVEFDGHLAQNVEFLGGLLGHLEKGGRFSVMRAELAPGRWVVTQLIVEIKGNALLFKSINLRQTDSMTDFHPIPGDLNVAQAADLLKGPAVTEVAGRLGAGGGSSGTAR